MRKGRISSVLVTGMRHVLWIICLVVPTGGQFFNKPSSCKDFYSPKRLFAEETMRKAIQMPIDGGQYDRNQFCEWVITTERDDLIVRLQIERVKLEGKDIHGECNHDYIDIFDYKNGQPVFMDRICASAAGQIFDSTGNKMKVTFQSNNAFEYDGFGAVFQAIKQEPVDEDEDDRATSVAVGITVSLLVVAMIFIFVIVVVRILRAKKATSQQRVFSNIPPEGRVIPHTRVSEPSSDALPFVETHRSARDGSVAGETRYGYDTGFQVALPPHDIQATASPQSRSPSPPPAYESLGYGPSDVSQPNTALTPPPYEMVIKENADRALGHE